MKRGTPRHPKTAHLAQLLGAKLPTAVGYLELLWQFAAEFAPQGDIGKYSDERIADACFYTGRKPSKFIDCLLESGFLDLTEGLPDLSNTVRFVIHDWPDHCEDSVKKRLARAGLPFLSVSRKMSGHAPTMSGTQPDNGSLPSPSPSPLPSPPSVAGVRERTSAEIWPSAGFTDSAEFEGWWAELVREHPNRNANALAKLERLAGWQWESAVGTGQLLNLSPDTLKRLLAPPAIN